MIDSLPWLPVNLSVLLSAFSVFSRITAQRQTGEKHIPEMAAKPPGGRDTAPGPIKWKQASSPTPGGAAIVLPAWCLSASPVGVEPTRGCVHAKDGVLEEEPGSTSSELVWPLPFFSWTVTQLLSSLERRCRGLGLAEPHFLLLIPHCSCPVSCQLKSVQIPNATATGTVGLECLGSGSWELSTGAGHLIPEKPPCRAGRGVGCLGDGHQCGTLVLLWLHGM